MLPDGDTRADGLSATGESGERDTYPAMPRGKDGIRLESTDDGAPTE